MASALFSSLSLRKLTLDNRIAVSPRCQYSAREGNAADWRLMHLGNLCISGPGLVMVEATAVEPRGRITHGGLGLYSDRNEESLRRILKFCREYGRAGIGLQLPHAGRKATDHLPWEEHGRPLGPGEGAWTTAAPSPVRYDERWPAPEALDRAGMEGVKAALVQATQRAVRLDFDTVELHAAPGYLLHEFVSPLSNYRSDDYGASCTNRRRFSLEVFAAMRAVWPDHKPLGVRISATDYAEAGWGLEDSLVLAGDLKKAGGDFLDVSGGGLTPYQKIAVGLGYQVEYAARIRREAGLPVMTVGMINFPRQAEEIISRGQADLVCLARGMLIIPAGSDTQPKN